MSTEIRLELADLIEAEARPLDDNAERTAASCSLALSRFMSPYELDCYRDAILLAFARKIAAKVRADAAFREAMTAEDTDPQAIISGLCWACGRDLASREPGE